VVASSRQYRGLPSTSAGADTQELLDTEDADARCAVAAASRPSWCLAALLGHEKAGPMVYFPSKKGLNIKCMLPHKQQMIVWLIWTCGARYNKNRDPEMHFLSS